MTISSVLFTDAIEDFEKLAACPGADTGTVRLLCAFGPNAEALERHTCGAAVAHTTVWLQLGVRQPRD